MSTLPLAVAVVVRQDDRFLLIRRAGPPFTGWWSPVTGRVEPGESLAQAAVREAREEMGITVEPGEEFYVCPTADGSHELHFLEARWTGGDPVPSPREVGEWGWFTLEEAAALEPFFPSDLIALRLLGER